MVQLSEVRDKRMSAEDHRRYNQVSPANKRRKIEQGMYCMSSGKPFRYQFVYDIIILECKPRNDGCTIVGV
jgi:hypothetical protein